MKKELIAALSLAAVVAGGSLTLAVAFTAPGQGIKGSKHDINAYATEMNLTGSMNLDDQQRLCAYCHTPHHAYDPTAPDTGDYLPLWSHEMTGQFNYTPYYSDTFQGTDNATDPLRGPSRLCMSCHDGVVAADTHYTNLGDPGNGTYAFTGDLFDNTSDKNHAAVGAGATLANDHPIGFNYEAARDADAQKQPKKQPALKASTETFAGSGVQIGEVLHQGIMTCATCHDVHNKDNVASANPNTPNYFVYSPQEDSALCTSCHIK